MNVTILACPNCGRWWLEHNCPRSNGVPHCDECRSFPPTDGDTPVYVPEWHGCVHRPILEAPPPARFDTFIYDVAYESWSTEPNAQHDTYREALDFAQAEIGMPWKIVDNVFNRIVAQSPDA